MSASTGGALPFSAWIWIGACAAGEAVGLVLSGAVNALIVPALGEPGTAAAGTGLGALMVAAGAIEGTCVGVAQWLVLRRVLRGVAGVPWVGATAGGLAIAWTLGALASAVEPAAPSTGAVFGFAAASGLVVGVSVGLLQGLVLRRRHLVWGHWVLFNALGWLGAMVVSFLGASGLSPGAYDAGSLALGLMTGAAAGAILGGATAFELAHLGRGAEAAGVE